LLVRRLIDATAREPWLIGSRDVLSISDWEMRPLYSMVG
jgi:hypothetical protein